MMAVSIAKGICAAMAGGYIAKLAVNALAVSSTAATFAAVAFGSFSALLFYARVWIQGYYFDNRYTKRADLAGRVVIVTGGTVGGLGFAGAQLLCELGATIVLTVRSDAKGVEAASKLGAKTSYVLCDFSSVASVRQAAKQILQKHTRCDMLVLNAGVGSGDKARMWMSNHVGPYMFTELLRPLLESTAKAHGDVRICAVSSGAHKRAAIDHDNPWEPGKASPGALGGSAYGQSKLAQIMHLRALQAKMRARPGLGGESTIRCIAVTPGFSLTNITVGAKPPPPARLLMWLMARSAHVGAMVIKMACIDPDVPGGSYLSNCYVKPSEGADGCSNSPEEWQRLIHTTERSVMTAETRFP